MQWNFMVHFMVHAVEFHGSLTISEPLAIAKLRYCIYTSSTHLENYIEEEFLVTSFYKAWIIVQIAIFSSKSIHWFC